MTDISKISNGTNTYNIKDATAREGLSSKQDILTPGTGIDITNGVISTTVNNLSGVQSSISGDTVTFGVKQSEIGSTPGSLYINSGSSSLLSGDITLRAGFNHPGNVNIIAAGSLDGGLRLKTAYNKLTLDKASSAGEIGGNVTFGTNVLTVSDSVFTYKGDAVALAKNIPSSVIVDQTYNDTSTNAQSGTAVKSAIDSAISSVYKPAGSIAFSSLPTPSSSNLGYVYNMTDNFTTDSRFIEGSGKTYPAGSNVVIIDGSNITTYYAWEEPFSEDIWTTSESPNIGDAIYYIRDETVTKGSQTVTEFTNDYIRITNASRPYSRESRYDTIIQSSGYFFDVLAGVIDLSGYVPTTRKINNKALSSDITLSASDIGALPSSTVIPTVDQTYDGTSTNAQSGVAIEPQLDKKLDLLDFSLIVPDTSKMTVLKTIDFDIAATTSYKFCYFVNNMSNLWDIKGEAIFRMTVTGTNINQNIEGIISMRQGFEAPYVVIRNRRGSTTAATSGIRYIYAHYPKAFENGYNWEFEFAAYDATARHVKIEILKSDTGFNWIETLTATTYNSTYQGSGSLTAYTTDGIIGIPNLYWNASSASSAGYITSYFSKTIGGTQPLAGAALLANQFVYVYNNKIYPATNKTNTIEPGFGIVFNSTAVSSGSAEDYKYMRQKASVTSLGNIPHATLARGNPCYFRCTIDSNGNIKSDNYVATSMAAGYTWYYVGIAQSSSAINIDTTQSFFLTLDSSGNLTHINGKKIGGAGTITVDQTYDGTSTNAQSGVAINSVLGDIETLINAL